MKKENDKNKNRKREKLGKENKKRGDTRKHVKEK